MGVKPLGNRVLVKVEEAEEKTKGGIYIPETVSKEKTTRGVIEAVGDDEAITVKVGDVIIYDKYAGTQIKIEDKDYLLVSIEDVLAVVA